jgi:hypothetical protein
MRWLIVNTDYPDFTRQSYATHPGLEHESYDRQWHSRVASLFGVADFYSTHLRELGHEAWDVIANCAPMQKQWAREHDLACGRDEHWRFRLRRGWVPWLSRERNRQWLYDILEAQLKAYRPDVFYSMAIETLGSDFVRRAKKYCRLAVGQHAAPLPAHDLSAYDLMLSSLPNMVDHFRQQGLRSELVRLAFEPRVLQYLDHAPKQYDIVFVGGLAGPHEHGTQMLEQLARRHGVRVWGYGGERLPADSPLHGVCAPPVWGLDMYRVLHAARIVFNRHIDIAGEYANNMRLYEATGVGTLLLTDRKDNLAEIFEPGREVVAYGGIDECVELAAHYLQHDEQRAALARAGQARTLREHTWAHRMRELVDVVCKYL